MLHIAAIMGRGLDGGHVTILNDTVHGEALPRFEFVSYLPNDL